MSHRDQHRITSTNSCLLGGVCLDRIVPKSTPPETSPNMGEPVSSFVLTGHKFIYKSIAHRISEPNPMDYFNL